MGIHTIRLPDVGEGVAEAELVEWQVNIGDVVKEDEVVAAVMTDKAAVEVPSPVTGTVTWLGGEIGDLIAVGEKLIQLSVEGDGNDTQDAAASVQLEKKPIINSQQTVEDTVTEKSNNAELNTRKPTASVSDPMPKRRSPRSSTQHAQTAKPLAAPSVRARAKDEGIDLRNVPGSGPAGRISQQDLSDFIESGGTITSSGGGSSRKQRNDVRDVKVIGMRRKIAEKMTLSKSRIPHITIVEEIDMTELEELRAALNKKHGTQRTKLTLLPFMMRAIVEAVSEQPELNARYDDEAGVVKQYGSVNIGIATQTENGLNVIVVDHAESAGLWDNATRVSQLADDARAGTIKLENLTGGTITITSLGALGAIATTPIINHPEVAIVGINKMQIRPMWDGQQFQPSKMMNISCSFDHRVVDGWDAAVFVQKLKTLLESPAMLFVEG